MKEPKPLTQSAHYTGVAAEVPVVKESTTSRVIHNNPLLRVVEFTFDEGEMLTEHTSPRAVVVQLLEGRMSFTVGDDEVTLAPADVVYLAPNERHALVAQLSATAWLAVTAGLSLPAMACTTQWHAARPTRRFRRYRSAWTDTRLGARRPEQSLRRTGNAERP